jgi:hypothetical protein
MSKARGSTRRACADVRARRVEGGRSPMPTSAGPHIRTCPMRRASRGVTHYSGQRTEYGQAEDGCLGSLTRRNL